MKKDNLSQTFGSYIRNLRISLEIGQRELAQKISIAPSFASSAGSKIEGGWNNYTENSNSNNTNTYSSEAKDVSLSFTIKDKKEQCAAIGFKPETDKFADCVLRLVELDVKKQQSNKIANAQNSGNEALVKQLQRQEYDRGTDALLNLGQQLLQPKSSSYSTCSYIDLGGGMSKVKCN